MLPSERISLRLNEACQETKLLNWLKERPSKEKINMAKVWGLGSQRSNFHKLTLRPLQLR